MYVYHEPLSCSILTIQYTGFRSRYRRTRWLLPLLLPMLLLLTFFFSSISLAAFQLRLGRFIRIASILPIYTGICKLYFLFRCESALGAIVYLLEMHTLRLFFPVHDHCEACTKEAADRTRWKRGKKSASSVKMSQLFHPLNFQQCVWNGNAEPRIHIILFARNDAFDRDMCATSCERDKSRECCRISVLMIRNSQWNRSDKIRSHGWTTITLTLSVPFAQYVMRQCTLCGFCKRFMVQNGQASE